MTTIRLALLAAVLVSLAVLSGSYDLAQQRHDTTQLYESYITNHCSEPVIREEQEI